MPWLAAVLVGGVSNLDNLGVGIAFGIRGRRIDVITNLIIGGITMAATAAAVTCGHGLLRLIPSRVTVWLGPLIIISIGIATVISARTSRSRHQARAPSGAWSLPRGVDGVISRREATVVGIGLSVNNLGAGLGAGLSGLPVAALTVSAGVLSLACMGGGSRVGSALGRFVGGRHAPLVAGLLLLAVGTAMLPSMR